MSLAKEVHDTFEKVNLFKNGLVEWKNIGRTDLAYLKWAVAWKVLKEHFPDSHREYTTHERPDNRPGMIDVLYYTDGSASVECTVEIRKGEETYRQSTWRPILNHSNKTVVNPSAMEVNTAKQRCLVKTLAEMGLGLNIFMGRLEDYEGGEDSISGEQVKAFNKRMQSLNVEYQLVHNHTWSIFKKNIPELTEQELLSIEEHVTSNASNFRRSR
tara:strand:+ start:66 stop:707 length:642 start_codon:yes stop_codon:yes gene_type:complete